MCDLEEKIVELKKYFKKILIIINNETVFTLIKTKFVNKNRIDDIICCIEGTFPEEYKHFLKKGKQLKSSTYYTQLLKVVRTPFWLNQSLYSVKHEEVEYYITAILSSIESDIRFVYSNESELFK